MFPTATAASKLSFVNGTSTYVVDFPLGYTVPAILPADSTAVVMGSTEGYCVVPTTSYTWTACGTCYKIKRTLKATIQNPDCNAAQVLTDLVAFYANDPTIVSGSVVAAPVVAGMQGNAVTPTTDNCKTEYQLEQWSECMTDGCDWTAEATFKPVQAFNGFTFLVDVCTGWTVNVGGCPIPPAVVAEDFVAGIGYEVIYQDDLEVDCAYSAYDGYSKEPINVRLSFGEWNKTKICNKYDVPFKVTQNFVKETGRGHNIFPQIVKTQYNEGNLYRDSVSENSYKLDKSTGLQWGIQPNHFYNCVQISFDSVGQEMYYQSNTGRKFTYNFWYDITDVKTGQDVIATVNRLLAKGDLPLLV